MIQTPRGSIGAIILASLGVCLFLNGGILFRQASGFLEISDFGWFLLPLSIYILRDQNMRRTLSQHLASFEQALIKPRTYGLVVAVIASVLFTSHTYGMLNRYFSFRADWDLAIYANACANNLHSSLRGETTLLADHFEPFLYLFTPLCRSFDPAIVLVVIQCIGLMLGGLGALRLARALGLSRAMSLAVFFLYVNFPGHLTTLRYDFHVLGLAMATLPWLIYAAFKRTWWLYALVALIHISLKENASLSIFAFGIFLLLKQRKLPGLMSVFFGVIAFAVIMKVAFPFYRNGQESLYFQKYYDHLGKDMHSIALLAVQNPLYFAGQILTVSRITYVLKLLLPFMFIPLIAPSTLIPIVPAVAINVMSKDRYMFGGGFHYQAEIYPFLFCCTLWALSDRTANPLYLKVQILLRQARLRSHSLLQVWIIFLIVFFSGKCLGWYAKFYEPTTYHRYLRARLLDALPTFQNEKVAAIEKVATHLARIPHVYLLDQAQQAETIVIAYPQGNDLWQYNQTKLEEDFIPALAESWDKTYEDATYADFRVWQKREK